MEKDEMKDEKVVVRKATRDDVEIVGWAVPEALDIVGEDPGRYVAECSDDESLYSWRNAFVAEVDGKAVGCLVGYDGGRYDAMRSRTWPRLWRNIDPELMRQTPAETRAGEYYLDTMAIMPGYRGHDIGHKLMMSAMDYGKSLGFRKFALIVDVNKPRLQRYYESLGFREDGEVVFFGHRFNRMVVSED